jgi:hypothetical protein
MFHTLASSYYPDLETAEEMRCSDLMYVNCETVVELVVLRIGTGGNKCKRRWKLCLYLKKKTPWPGSASDLYRPSDRRLSRKLVPTFEGTGCHVVSVTNPYGCNLCFLDRNRYFLFQVAPQLYLRGWWTPFRTHYCSENLVAPRIETGPLDM